MGMHCMAWPSWGIKCTLPLGDDHRHSKDKIETMYILETQKFHEICSGRQSRLQLFVHTLPPPPPPHTHTHIPPPQQTKQQKTEKQEKKTKQRKIALITLILIMPLTFLQECHEMFEYNLGQHYRWKALKWKT